MENSTLKRISVLTTREVQSLNLLLPLITAEQNMEKENLATFVLDERLMKRRAQYTFDLHLQNSVLMINIPNTVTKVIPCGSSGLYKSELILNNGFTIHYNHSFCRDAKYNEYYLAMNRNRERPRYAYFLYTLNDEKCDLSSLQFIVPNYEDTRNIAQYNLMSLLKRERELKLTFDIQIGRRI